MEVPSVHENARVGIGSNRPRREAAKNDCVVPEIGPLGLSTVVRGHRDVGVGVVADEVADRRVRAEVVSMK